MKYTQLVGVALGALAVSQAHAAITFSNITFNAPPLSTGAAYTTAGNSISFTTPNAIVGDVSPTRAGSLTITYIADSGVLMNAVNAFVSVGAPTLGTGTVAFLETVYAYDLGTMMVGASLGTISHSFNSTSDPNFTGTISLSAPTRAIYVVKRFDMNAPDSPDLDLAAIAIVNQSISTVPEPTSIAALGLGLAFVLRRRRA